MLCGNGRSEGIAFVTRGSQVRASKRHHLLYGTSTRERRPLSLEGRSAGWQFGYRLERFYVGTGRDPFEVSIGLKRYGINSSGIWMRSIAMARLALT